MYQQYTIVSSTEDNTETFMDFTKALVDVTKKGDNVAHQLFVPQEGCNGYWVIVVTVRSKDSECLLRHSKI